MSTSKHILAALNRYPRGIQAMEVFEHILQDREIFGLLGAILRKSYFTFFGEAGLNFVNEYIARLPSFPNPAVSESIAAFVQPTRARFIEIGLSHLYTSSFRCNNLDASIRLIGAEQFGGTVIDVGADDNLLGNRLLHLSEGVVKVIGLDVEERNPTTVPNMLEFRLQLTRKSLPVQAEEADIAVCRYALHHMTYVEQGNILMEIHRGLKPTGRCVVYENSYSLRLEPELPDVNGFNASLLSIGEPVRLRLLLAGLDTFSLGIKNKDMTFPHSFRSFEEWSDLFRTCGFRVRKSDYFGIPVFDLHQAPLACFILEKRNPPL